MQTSSCSSRLSKCGAKALSDSAISASWLNNLRLQASRACCKASVRKSRGGGDQSTVVRNRRAQLGCRCGSSSRIDDYRDHIGRRPAAPPHVRKREWHWMTVPRPKSADPARQIDDHPVLTSASKSRHVAARRQVATNQDVCSQRYGVRRELRCQFYVAMSRVPRDAGITLWLRGQT